MNDAYILYEVEKTIGVSKRIANTNNQLFEMLFEEKEFDYLSPQDYSRKIDQFGRDLGGERGEKIAKIGKNIGKGVLKSSAKKALARKIIAQITKRAASFTKLTGKAVPLLGDVVAIIDGLIESVVFVKSLKNTTELILETTGAELSGLGSLRGKYSILEANSEDLEKIADILETKSISGEISPQQIEMIRQEYFEAMRSLKGLLINILMLAKYAGGPFAIAAAISAYILPIELGAKELFYYLHTKIADFSDLLENSEYGVLRIIEKIGSLQPAALSLVPIVGFLSDYDKVRALGRIDDVLTGEFTKEGVVDYSTISGSEHIEDMKRKQSFTSGGEEIADIVAQKALGLDFSRLGKIDYAGGLADLADAQLGESKTKTDKLVLERWQVLAGIN